MLINKRKIQLALSKNHRKRKNSIGNNQLTQTKYIKYKSRLKYFRRLFLVLGLQAVSQFTLMFNRHNYNNVRLNSVQNGITRITKRNGPFPKFIIKKSAGSWKLRQNRQSVFNSLYRISSSLFVFLH